jgi:SAM-dependent methyltransferase
MKDLNHQIKYWDSVAGKKKFTHPFDACKFRELVSKDSRILDVGCGYGRVCQTLYESGYTHVVGIDISPQMIREGLNLFPHLKMQCSRLDHMPFEENSFDVAILFAVLTCTPTDQGQLKLIDSVLRALKPNGLIHVSDYFLQDDRRNRLRYDTCHRKYGVYGMFELGNGPVLRHHARPWIETLLSPFHQISITEMNAPTMNGHLSTIFQYWGRKSA